MDLPALPTGVTAVTSVRLHDDEERLSEPVLLPVSLLDGQWTVDTTSVADGRWWGAVVAAKGAVPYEYPLRDPIDLPEDDTLCVSPESLAEWMGVPLPLTAARRRVLRQALDDAQTDVRAYLGQPVMPERYIERGVSGWGERWTLTAHGDTTVQQVLSVEPEADPVLGGLDTFTITYLAGLNARDDVSCSPIRRYIKAHAANLPEATRLWREAAQPADTVKSLSAEGQSVTYESATLGGGGAAGSGNPGALPTAKSMDAWRVAGRRVYQSATRAGVRY